MTPSPEKYEPTPEQVEEVANLAGDFIGSLRFRCCGGYRATVTHCATEAYAKIQSELSTLRSRVEAAQSVNQDWQQRFVECVAQRDDARSERGALKAALYKIYVLPIHSEPMGGIMHMKDIAHQALTQLEAK